MPDELERLKQIADFFRRMNSKLLLLKLLDKAKEEYETLDFVNGKASLYEALKLDETNPVTLRGLGCMEQFEGNFQKAKEYFFKALENSSRKEIEYTLLGMVYYFEDNLDSAVKYFNMAIDSNIDYDKAYEGRNQAMLENHLKVIDLQESLKKYF